MQETPFNSWVGKICWKRSPVFLGFPGGWAGKESACNVGDLGSIPRLGRSPGEGNGYPHQYSGLENSMDYIIQGVIKNRTQLRDFHYTCSGCASEEKRQEKGPKLLLLADFQGLHNKKKWQSWKLPGWALKAFLTRNHGGHRAVGQNIQTAERKNCQLIIIFLT